MSVKIYYGPYEAHGVLCHRPQKLRGVLDRLKELDFETELIPSPFINVVTVSMQNKQIFRCNVRNLMFNIDFLDDPVAQLLVVAVEEARGRFYSALNVPRFSLEDDDDINAGGNLGSHHLYVIPHDKKKMKHHKMNRHEAQKFKQASNHEVEIKNNILHTQSAENTIISEEASQPLADDSSEHAENEEDPEEINETDDTSA